MPPAFLYDLYMASTLETLKTPGSGGRRASVNRATKETRISAAINLDGTGVYDIKTGIGFLDHMLEQLSRHSLIDITLRAEGDLHIDYHHTTEDSGIVLGECLAKALGDRAGIRRYGSAVIPMDETLTEVALDASNRPYLIWKVNFSKPKLGTMDTELFKEWFQAFAQLGGLDAACLEPLRREQPPHRRELLQGPRPRAARRRSRSTRARRRRCPAPRACSRRAARMTVAIVDYGSGNLRSAAKAFERAAREAGTHERVLVTADPREVAAADRIVLPGVGAFADCRAGLYGVPGMVEVLQREVIERGKAVPRHLRRHAAHGDARRRVRRPRRPRLDRGRRGAHRARQGII